MPKHKGKGKNGGRASKKLKTCGPCNLSAALTDNCDKYQDLVKDGKEFTDDVLSVQTHPFTTAKISNLVNAEFLSELGAELQSLDLTEKDNDLYKFRQTDELNQVELPAISAFRRMLLQQLKPIISRMIGCELTDKLALFGARYERTDYLLCHDDELEGRRVAFIMYLVPECWGLGDGGNLELFTTG